jgi:hypothetical protein
MPKPAIAASLCKIGVSKIAALVEQRDIQSLGTSVGKAVAKIEIGRMAGCQPLSQRQISPRASKLILQGPPHGLGLGASLVSFCTSSAKVSRPPEN